MQSLLGPRFPSYPDSGSAPRAHAIREHRWRHIEHLLFDCAGISGLGGSLAVTLLRVDLFTCFGSDHARAVLLATFPSDQTPAIAATACIVPFLLDNAAALGGHPPLRIKLKCCGFLAWCVVCGVHAAASVRMHVGKPPPSCSVVRPLVVAPPAVRICICPRAAHCASSCCAHVRLRPQGRCGRCGRWMPAWVCRDIRPFFSFLRCCLQDQRRCSRSVISDHATCLVTVSSHSCGIRQRAHNPHRRTSLPDLTTIFPKEAHSKASVASWPLQSPAVAACGNQETSHRCPLMHMRPQTGGSVVGLGIPCAAMVLADV